MAVNADEFAALGYIQDGILQFTFAFTLVFDVILALFTHGSPALHA